MGMASCSILCCLFPSWEINMIRVSCPKCKSILQVEDKQAGQVIACSKCKTSMRLPQVPSAPTPLPPVVAVPVPTVPKAIQTPPLPPVKKPASAPAQSAPAPTQTSPAKSQASTVLARLRQGPMGKWLTPKWIAIGCGAVASISLVFVVLLVVVVVINTKGSGGPSSKANAGSRDKNAAQDGGAPAVSKVDLLKGPKGEEITKVEEGKEQMSGFKNKNGKLVRHGPYVLFHDQIGGKKKVQGECYAGQWHGKLTGWYEDGSLWFERWYDKGKPVGTHKGYDGKDNIAWELRFDDGKPRISEVDCFCVVCQLAFLYGTASWNKTNPFNENCTLFRFTKTTRKNIPDTEFLWLLGQPQERHDVLPHKNEVDWVYRCKDGTVTCRVVKFSNPLTMTQTKVSGRRKF
jgi:hypothetical protein